MYFTIQSCIHQQFAMVTRDDSASVHALLLLQFRELNNINKNFFVEHKDDISRTDTFAIGVFGEELRLRWGVENADDAATVLLFWAPVIKMLLDDLGPSRQRSHILRPRLITSRTIAHAGQTVRNEIDDVINKQTQEL